LYFLCVTIKNYAMENIPLYISLVFIATAFFTLFFLYRAGNKPTIILVVALLWMVLQSVIAATGFYQQTTAVPPRFLLTILPSLALILTLFLTRRGKKWINSFNTTWLTYLHIVRIPVELVLLWLFMYQQLPQLMTFEGRNFDILSGITAPFVAFFGYKKLKLNTAVLLAWNFICLALLFNIVIIAVLSAPFPFQQLAFNQSNVAILHFPFVLLPAFIVPVVLFAHLVCITKLINNFRKKQ
jgi:hypothetical protein